MKTELGQTKKTSLTNTLSNISKYMYSHCVQIVSSRLIVISLCSQFYTYLFQYKSVQCFTFLMFKIASTCVYLHLSNMQFILNLTVIVPNYTHTHTHTYTNGSATNFHNHTLNVPCLPRCSYFFAHNYYFLFTSTLRYQPCIECNLCFILRRKHCLCACINLFVHPSLQTAKV